jgi:hypothetical protein
MQERKIQLISPFDGSVIAEETFYFQLTKADFVEMELLDRDDVEGYLKSVMEGNNAIKTLKVAKEMIIQAAGVKDGARLVKYGTDKFIKDGWWEALFEQLFQEDNPMEFIIGILPQDVRQGIAAEHAKTYTDAELMAMSEPDFYKAAGTKSIQDMDPRFIQLAINRKTNKSADAA